MKPFRERNPIPIAVGGLLAIALLLLGSFNLDKIPLPIFGRTTAYQAAFTNAAGIARENEVRVAGVRVGSVTGVSLDVPGKQVLVKFQVDQGIDLGEETKAAIKLKTLLGTKYLELTPAGTGRLAKGDTIPLARTTVPFQIYDAFNQLSATIDQVDTKKLALALDTLADTFRDSKGNARSALTGLSALSRTISSRDAQLAELLAGTKKVTAALAARDSELTKLIGDADLVMQVVLARRQAISALLNDTSRLATQLTSLVRANRAQLDPLLDNLHSVVGVLKSNLGNLDKAVASLGPFARYTANATGNGTWLDVYSENLVVSDQLLCALGAC
ncbi:MAG: phospholipid/cholesterol/gamma-HCH transport system substrate-binding protein [Frankiaceae bacterium]|jgi:phospholipid/cholesterol/gamma-HCH transport system substrate-binding protein|nr:phospholipid/cholesterol/gamma-HCH transport system substrate-binding protein [Frankiaceae bacterium]